MVLHACPLPPERDRSGRSIADGELVTVAVIVLAIALAGAVAALGLLAYWLRDSLAEQRTALLAQGLAEHAKDAAEQRADLADAESARVKAELAAALAQLEATQKAANAAGTTEATHVAQTIAAAPDAASALADLNRELLAPVSGTIDGGGPAAASPDHGDPRPATVHVAADAKPGSDGGHP